MTNYRPKSTGRERKNARVVYNVSHFSFVSSTLNSSVPQLEFPNARVSFLRGSLCVIVGGRFLTRCFSSEAFKHHCSFERVSSLSRVPIVRRIRHY